MQLSDPGKNVVKAGCIGHGEQSPCRLGALPGGHGIGGFQDAAYVPAGAMTHCPCRQYSPSSHAQAETSASRIILLPSTINSRLGHRIDVIDIPAVGTILITLVLTSISMSTLRLVSSATVTLVPMAPTAISNTPSLIKFR